MKKFLAIFIGTEASFEKSGWNALDAERRRERETNGLNAWTEWGIRHAAAIVDQGAPLGKTKRVSPEGIAGIKNVMAGYVIVQAESHDAAARLFENHPHFSIFPGDSVEVMECLPLPDR